MPTDPSLLDPSIFTYTPVGIIHSPFKEKFGIPRQPGLTRNIISTIKILPPFNRAEAFRGLEAFSHIWLSFIFHQNIEQGWKPTIRPPRLGGNKRIGVFASRSSFRPNGLGMSVVELLDIEIDSKQVHLIVAGADLLNETPIIDIKPYIPYSDSVPDAKASYADAPPPHLLSVIWQQNALSTLDHLPDSRYPRLKALIEDILSADPRPAYKNNRDDSKVYGIQLFDLDIRFIVKGSEITVVDVLHS